MHKMKELHRIIEREVELRNREPGQLNVDHVDESGEAIAGDGIDCSECLNKGFLFAVVDDVSVGSTMVVRPCKCAKQRALVRRIRESGLADKLDDYTFENFDAAEPWQQAMVVTGKRYISDGIGAGHWLYLGGQSGSGKTHIATAVVGQMISTMDVLCVTWPQMAQRLKAAAMDGPVYASEIQPLQEAGLLLIDDFFKPTRSDGSLSVSGADVRLAFDIIDSRYLSEKPTIISSEWFLTELIDIDEAVGGRIFDKCHKYTVNVRRDKARNHRYHYADAVV